MAYVPDAAFDRLGELSARAFVLYTFLCRCRNQNTGKCCPSVHTTAEAIGISRASVFALRKELVAAGWVSFDGDNARLTVGFASPKNQTTFVDQEELTAQPANIRDAEIVSPENQTTFVEPVGVTKSLENWTEQPPVQNSGLKSLENWTEESRNLDSHIRKNQQREPAKEPRGSARETMRTDGGRRPRREDAGEVPFSSVSPDAALTAIEAMTTAVFQQYAIKGNVDGRFERQITEQVGRLNGLGCTPDNLLAFFDQRTRLPSLNHLVTDWQTWSANEQRALSAKGKIGGPNGQSQRPRETHNGRNARLTLELLGVEPQLARPDLGVPDPGDEPAQGLALVERRGRRA